MNNVGTNNYYKYVIFLRVYLLTITVIKKKIIIHLNDNDFFFFFWIDNQTKNEVQVIIVKM